MIYNERIFIILILVTRVIFIFSSSIVTFVEISKHKYYHVSEFSNIKVLDLNDCVNVTDRSYEKNLAINIIILVIFLILFVSEKLFFYHTLPFANEWGKVEKVKGGNLSIIMKLLLQVFIYLITPVVNTCGTIFIYDLIIWPIFLCPLCVLIVYPSYYLYLFSKEKINIYNYNRLALLSNNKARNTISLMKELSVSSERMTITGVNVFKEKYNVELYVTDISKVGYVDRYIEENGKMILKLTEIKEMKEYEGITLVPNQLMFVYVVVMTISLFIIILINMVRLNRFEFEKYVSFNIMNFSFVTDEIVVRFSLLRWALSIEFLMIPVDIILSIISARDYINCRRFIRLIKEKMTLSDN